MGEHDTIHKAHEAVTEQNFVTVAEKPNRTLWAGALGLLVLMALAPVYGSRPAEDTKTTLMPIASPTPVALPLPMASLKPVASPEPTLTPTPTPIASPAVTGPMLSLREAQTALKVALPGLTLPFPLHSSELGVTHKRALERVANILRHSPETTIEIGGYAEEEYKKKGVKGMLALGYSRVQISLIYLISCGVPSEQVVGVSYGKRYVTKTAPPSGIEIRVNAKN
jgi:outer membrane protein OmpA-like peptidoglycan-associated protein